MMNRDKNLTQKEGIGKKPKQISKKKWEPVWILL